MKSNKRKDAPSSDIAPREQFSLELVAATALRFLTKEELWRPGCQMEAVHAAIRFLKMCANRIEADKKDASYHAEQLKEFANLGWKATDIIPYEIAIKFVTGQKRLDRAQACYKAYVKNHYSLQEPLTDLELTAALKTDKKEGFVAETLPLLRLECRRMRKEGRRGPKRRKMLQK
jgi:hypothetical protein